MALIDTAAAFVFWSSALVLAYVYGGYRLLLIALRGVAPRTGVRSPTPTPGDAPRLTVLVTIHNEEGQVVQRLEDLMGQDYPSDRFDILVASDGSTDATKQLVEGFATRSQADGRVRLCHSSRRRGKSAAQNAAMELIRADVVVLTDAATRFDRRFLAEIAQPFADPAVGCVTGRIDFVERPGAVARGQGRYWRHELQLRELESGLGLLAVASGQAMAFRRSLFRPLPEHVGDDCMIPLDVVLAGCRVVHRAEARAFDVLEHDWHREIRSRIRMTMRNWTGTWLRSSLLNPWRHPGYALALWSHKLLRWLGSVLLLLMTAAALRLAHSPLYQAALLALVGLSALAAVGWWSNRSGRRWAVAETAFSFLVGNLGFLVGVWRAVTKQRIVAYRSGSLGR